MRTGPERKGQLAQVARQLAAQARSEAEWFEGRAEQCERAARAIEESADPEQWEQVYQTMLGEWGMSLEGPESGTPRQGRAP